MASETGHRAGAKMHLVANVRGLVILPDSTVGRPVATILPAYTDPRELRSIAQLLLDRATEIETRRVRS